MKKPRVAAYLRAMQEKETQLAKRYGQKVMDRAEVLGRLSSQGAGEFISYLNEDGSLDLKRLQDEGAGHLVKKLKIAQLKEGEKSLTRVEAEPVDPGSALEKLAKYHKLIDGDQEKPVQVNLYQIIQGLPEEKRAEVRAGIGHLFRAMLESGDVVEAEVVE